MITPHIPHRPYASSYTLILRRDTDRASLRHLIDGDDEHVDDRDLCAWCKCPLGFGEKDVCDSCCYSEDDRV